MKLEDLRTGASVLSSDGRKLGTISRFVVAGGSRKLTHIVVDTGILRSGTPLWEGGWGLSHDRVVPLGVLRDATSDEVRLTMTADEFRDLSVDYVQERFEPFPDDEPGRLDGSDIARLAMSIPGSPGAFLISETLAKDAMALDIREGLPVWRMNPHEKLGEVARLLFDEDTQTATAVVVHRGLLKKDLLLPLASASEVLPFVIRVDMDDTAVAALEEYEPQD